MTVYKRGGVYWYAFKWKSKRIQKSARTGNKQVARQIEAAHKTKLAKAEVGLDDARPAKEAPRFDEAMKAFLKWSAEFHKSKPATTRSYKTRSAALLAYFKQTKLDEIEPADVESFIEWREKQKRKAPARLLKKNPKAKTDKPIQPATINRELACLRAVFSYHIRKGVKLSNPVSQVRFLKENEDTFYVLSCEEEEKYLAECSVPLYDVAVIMLETGMRPNEVYRMERRHLHLEESYYFVPSGKTKAARRRIPLTERAKELLKEKLEEVEGQWVFPSPDNPKKPITKVNNAHYGALKRTKLPRFRIYDLRHTFATRAAEAGIDLVTLAALLGHSKLEMVLKYAHPTESHQKEAIKKFELYTRRVNGREQSQNF